MPKIISIINNKGGVGKTTTVQNLAVALTRKGYKVGLIDFDSQANLSSVFKLDKTILDLRSALSTKTLLTLDKWSPTKVENLWIIPNNRDVTSKVFEQFDDFEKSLIFKKIINLDNLGLDFVLVDTPPNLEIQTFNAMIGSTHVLIPTSLKIFSLSGLNTVIAKLGSIQEALKQEIKLLGVLVTQVDERLSTNQIAKELLENNFGNDVLLTSYVRTSAAYEQSQLRQMDIFQYGEKKCVDDYNKVAEELLNKLNTK